MAEGNVTVAVSHSWQDDRRGSRHERGYGTEWDKLRKVILKRDGYLCQCNECKGGELRLREATHVDHIVSKAEWRVNHGGSLEGVTATRGRPRRTADGFTPQGARPGGGSGLEINWRSGTSRRLIWTICRGV